MTNEEVGAYLRLVLDYYKNGALPDDPIRLRDIARVPVADWNRIWGQVQPKFRLGNDKNWHHEKCDEEIEWRNAMMLKKINQTKKALESRGINVTSDVTLDNPGTLHSTLHRKLHSTESESESESDTKKDIERLAEEIYQVYPLKVGKPAALKAIRTQLDSIAPEKLLELTKAYAAARKGDLDFVPHPSTWFNQQRFNDNPETWKPHANKSNTPQRVDRSIGTANEGIAHRYKGLGKLAANRPDQPSS